MANFNFYDYMDKVRGQTIDRGDNFSSGSFDFYDYLKKQRKNKEEEDVLEGKVVDTEPIKTNKEIQGEKIDNKFNSIIKVDEVEEIPNLNQNITNSMTSNNVVSKDDYRNKVNENINTNKDILRKYVKGYNPEALMESAPRNIQDRRLDDMTKVLDSADDIASAFIIPEPTKDVDKKLERAARMTKAEEGREGVIEYAVESFNRRIVMNMLSSEYVRMMNGLPNEVAKIEKWIEEHPEIYPYMESVGEGSGLLRKITGGAVDTTTLYLNGVTRPETVKMASNYATIAGVGAMALNAIPGAALVPEEVITVPAAMLWGAKSGINIGVTKNMMALEAGSAYSEYMEAGIPHEIAKPIASTVGVINGMIEKMQMDLAFRAVPGANETIALLQDRAYKEASKALSKLVMNYGLQLVPEVIEEMIQGSVEGAGQHLAELIQDPEAIENKSILGTIFKDQVNAGKYFASLVTGKDSQDARDGRAYIDLMADTATETFISFLLTPAIGTATNMAMNKTLEVDGIRTMAMTEDQRADYKKAKAEMMTALGDIELMADNFSNAEFGQVDKDGYTSLFTNKTLLEGVMERPDILPQDKAKVKVVVDKIDKVIDGSIYQAKELNPEIELAPTNKMDLEDRILQAKDASEINQPLYEDLSNSDIRYYKQAKDNNLLYLIEKKLKDGMSIGEIANDKEVMDRVPRRLKKKIDLINMVDSVEKVKDRINAERIMNSINNLDSSLETIENAQIEKPREVEEGLSQEDKPGQAFEVEDKGSVEEGIKTPEIEDKSLTEGIEDLEVQEDIKTEEISEKQEILEEKESPFEKYAPSNIVKVKVSDMILDPERFQFRYDADVQTGNVNRLKGAAYNEQLAGVILLWEDKDGDLYVVNGHHRVNLASQYNVESMNAEILSYKDYSAEDARALGAMINIAEDNATSVDVAKLIRDTGVDQADFNKIGIKENSKIAKDGLALAGLEDWLFQQVAVKHFPVERGVIIGDMLANDFDGQRNLVTTLNKQESKTGKTLTNAEMTELINIIKGSPRIIEGEQTLMGFEELDKNLYFEKAELVSYVKSQLKDRLRVLKNVSKDKNTNILQSLGNKLKIDKNIQSMNTSELALYILDKTVNYQDTAVSSLFNDLTVEYAEAGQSDKTRIKRKALNSFVDMMEQGTYMDMVGSPRLQREDAKIEIFGDTMELAGQGAMFESQAEYNLERQTKLYGDEVLSQLKEMKPLSVVVKDNVDQATYGNLSPIVEALKDNAFMNGLEVEFTGKETARYYTRGELDERGYHNARPGRYEITGAYIREGYSSRSGTWGDTHQLKENRGRILINNGAGKDTILHEVIHHLDRVIEQIDPELAELVDMWEGEVIDIANEEGIELPTRSELLTHVLVHGEFGYAKDNKLGDLISIDDEIVTKFETILGPEFLDMVEGKDLAIPSEYRAIRSEYQGYAERSLQANKKASSIDKAKDLRISEIRTELDSNKSVVYKSSTSDIYAMAFPNENGYRLSYFNNMGHLGDAFFNDKNSLMENLVEKGLIYKNDEVHNQLRKFYRTTVDDIYQRNQEGFLDTRKNIAIDDFELVKLGHEAKIGNMTPNDYDNLILNNDSLSIRQKRDLLRSVMNGVEKGYYSTNENVNIWQFLNRFYGIKDKGVRSSMVKDINFKAYYEGDLYGLRLNRKGEIELVERALRSDIKTKGLENIKVDRTKLNGYYDEIIMGKYNSLENAVDDFMDTAYYTEEYYELMTMYPTNYEDTVLDKIINEHFLYMKEMDSYRDQEGNLRPIDFELKDYIRDQFIEFRDNMETYRHEGMDFEYTGSPHYSTSYQMKEIADIKSDNFKKWFKDSKVVDESGEPLVVYHGTNRIFDSFDNESKGFYFTDDKEHSFIVDTDNTIKAYLSIDNPYYATRRYEVESAIYSTGWIQNENGVWEDSIVRSGDKTLSEQLQELGYDGIIYNGGIDIDYQGINPKQYVVFNPTQIKSIYNNGMFNEYDPNINYQLKYSDDGMEQYSIDNINTFIEDGKVTQAIYTDGETSTGETVLIVDKNLEGKSYDGVVRDAVLGAYDYINMGDNLTPIDEMDISKVYETEPPYVDITDDKLIVTHNLTENKLKNALKLGGFPAPSIAITRADMPISNFGEISLIFGKETIDPINKLNKVFASDVYSPRFPEVGYKINEKTLNNLNDELSNFSIGYEYIDSSDIRNKSVEDAGQYLGNRYSLKNAFLDSKDIVIEKPTMEKKLYNSHMDYAVVKDFVINNINSFSDIVNDKELRARYYDAIKEGLTLSFNSTENAERLATGFHKTLVDKIENELVFHETHGVDELDRYVKRFNEDIKAIKEGSEMVLDEYAYKDLIDTEIKKHSQEYNKFIIDKLEPLYEGVGLRNKKDLFTPSGNRRSFDALHMPYTLDNALKIIKGEIRAEEGFNYGLGSIRATVTPQFTSLANIKANIDKLTDGNSFNVLKELYNNEYYSLKSQLQEYHHGGHYFDNALDGALQEIGNSGRIDEMNIRSMLKEYSFNVDNIPIELLTEISKFMDDLKVMPTEYFEAKPQRAVTFDEVQAVVVPSDITPELEAMLIREGLVVEKYDNMTENTREKVIENLVKENEISFQMKPDKSFDANDIMQYYEALERDKDFDLRSWDQTVADAGVTSPELRELLSGDGLRYEVMHNEDTMLAAAKLIEDRGVRYVEAKIMSKGNDEVNAVLFGASQLLTNYFQETGDYDRALTLVEKTAEKATTTGQAIQILSWLGRQSPEGMLRYAQKTFSDLISEKDKRKINTGLESVGDIFDRINKEVLGTIDTDKLVSEVTKMSPEEMLAYKINNTLKSPRQKPVMDMMIKTLFDVAKESPLPKNKTMANNHLDFVVDAIVNREEYRDVWAKAKDLLTEQYKDDPSKMEILEPYFDKNIVRTFAETQLRKSMGQELKNMNLTIRDIIKENYSKQDKLRRTLAELLVEKAGLTDLEAELLEAYTVKEFDKLTREAKSKSLDSLFKEKKSFERKELNDRILEMSNLGAFADDNYRHLVAEKLGLPVMDRELQVYIHNQAEYIQTLEPGSRERDVQTALLMQRISDNIPVNMWNKVNTIQTMSHLLNPKTTMRNLVGNAIFGELDSFRHHFLGVPLDYMVSKFTDRRTAIFRPFDSIKERGKGYKQGFMLGLEDALMGIDTFEGDNKFGLRANKTFKGGIMSGLEKTLNITMRATDRASQTATTVDSIKEQMIIAGVNEPTVEMIEIAEILGAYRTFNDTTKMSEAFSTLKRGLNKIGFDGFGLGEILMKYPRTPANILMRGIDYSPIGLFNAMTYLAMNKDDSGYLKQKIGVEKISRSLLGTGLILGGAMLAKAGIITGGRSDDEDKVYNLKKQYGIRDYSLNKDALMRHIQTGFSDAGAGELQVGDRIVSYEWADPISLSIGVGADAVLGRGDTLDFVKTTLGMADSMLSTLTEQPMMTGVSRLFQYGLDEGISQTLKDIPSGFTPIFLGQIAQFLDGRNTNPYDGFTKGREAYNLMANKIPGLREKLPSRFAVLGEERRYYDEDKNALAKAFDIFINPAIKTEYTPNPNIDKMIRLYEETGMTDHIPARLPKSYTVDKVKYDLDAKEYEELSEIYGRTLNKYFGNALNGYAKSWVPEEQIFELQFIIKEVRDNMREEFIKRRGI